MRAVCVVAATAGLVGAATIGSSAVFSDAAASGPTACHPSGSTLVRSDSRATVFRIQSGQERTYYGCLSASGRQTKLTSIRIGRSSVRLLRLSGRFVGFVREGSKGSRVKLFDVSSGHHVTRDPGPGGFSDLVATRNGRIAWIIDYHYKSVDWSSFSAGSHEIDEDLCSAYDPASCIKPGSLRLTGQHHDRELTWIHSGETRHYVMP